MKRFSKLAITIGLVFSCSTQADVGSKVGNWFSDMNYATSTNPGVYEGQTARYATLGGFSARAPITQPFNLVNVQTPKFSGGCGGIDFYAGGFSAIDADQFVDQLRAIGQNAKSLAFMLAIQVVSPQLSGTMKDIQDFSNKYLNMNMDSCEAASALMGGALDMLGSEKANCIALRRKDYGEDFSTASWACTNGGSRESTNTATEDQNELAFLNGNLAWYVMMQDPFFQSDIEFAEMVLNIMGTLIITDEPGADGGKIPRIIPASIQNENVNERFSNIYTALLHGSNADNQMQIFECTGAVTANLDGCNVMSDTTVVKPAAWQGLYTRIDTLLTSIVTKIKSDSTLTPTEIGLIDSTTIPIYRYLTASSIAFPTGTDVRQISAEYTELIAKDILLSAVAAVIGRVEMQSSNMKGGLSFADNVKSYRDQLQGVMRGISILKKENNTTAKDITDMRESIVRYEKTVLERIGNDYVTSARWGQG